jgi:hypothetical protein
MLENKYILYWKENTKNSQWEESISVSPRTTVKNDYMRKMISILNPITLDTTI